MTTANQHRKKKKMTTTDDIVTRLQNGRGGISLLSEAATEIERLRADVDRWRKIAKGLVFLPSTTYIDAFNEYHEAMRKEEATRNG